MKLRLEDNTLRLRLSPEEVRAFSQQGCIQTVVQLGPAVREQLVYALVRDAAATGAAPLVAYESGQLTVRLPAALADAWTSTAEISLHGTSEVADNQLLYILVEKDLGCKH